MKTEGLLEMLLARLSGNAEGARSPVAKLVEAAGVNHVTSPSLSRHSPPPAAQAHAALRRHGLAPVPAIAGVAPRDLAMPTEAP